MSEHEPIYVLMSRVMEDIEAIPKNRRNEQQNFAFRGIDDVMSALHPALLKNGVFYTPRVVEDRYDSYTTGRGTLMRSAVIRVAYTFYGPAGDSVEVIGQGEAADSGDKATSKALAMALKYALLQTFCVPTEEGSRDDGDRTTPEPRVQLNPTVQQWLREGATPEGILEVATETARDLNVKEPGELTDIRPANYNADYLKTLKANVTSRFFASSEEPKPEPAPAPEAKPEEPAAKEEPKQPTLGEEKP